MIRLGLSVSILLRDLLGVLDGLVREPVGMLNSLLVDLTVLHTVLWHGDPAATVWGDPHGETLDEREAGHAESKVQGQIAAGLAGAFVVGRSTTPPAPPSAQPQFGFQPFKPITLATALAAALEPALAPALARWALNLTLAAAATRIASLLRNARLKPKSSLQSAIGMRHPHIVQKAQGFMGSAFSTREFFHGRTRELVTAVKWFFLLATFALPLALIALALGNGAMHWLAVACGVQYAGLLAERWFFFAQARHPQNLYYQAIS